MYSLERTRDGAGDSGSLSETFQYSEDGYTRINLKGDSRPVVGAAIRVGSRMARSYSAQDWWQTTYIKEILEDTPKMVRFLTENGSEYVWRCD